MGRWLALAANVIAAAAGVWTVVATLVVVFALLISAVKLLRSES